MSSFWNQQYRLISLKLLKHSLHCCTFSIFICEKYRIRIPHISLPNAYIETTNNQKKIKKLWPSVFAVRTERNISFIRYNASYKLTHSSYLVYILPTQIEGYFFSPNYFWFIYIYGSLKKREKECGKVEMGKNEG